MHMVNERRLTITEVRLRGDEYNYSWVLRGDEGIIKYGHTTDKSHEDLRKGKLVNIDGVMYIVTRATAEVLDSSIIKTELFFLEVDDDQWVIKFEDKVKGGR
ncbi:hypothetical protein [Bacillus phage MrBubbles]|nr:hypothetical protein [Bacillus phage MrBubbles]